MSLDLLNVFFERNTVKLDFVLLPAFIKFVACTTNMMIQFGSPVLCVSAGGRLVIFQRYICWMHTTATMLLLLKLMSKTITLRELATAIAFDEVMMTTGALACLTSGYLRVLLAFISHASLVPILFYMHKAFMGARIDTKSSVRVTLLITYTFTVALWISFGIVWDIAILDLVSPLVEEILYLMLDFCAKVLFSSTLMLGSFKGLEQQRLDTMRRIELRSKHSMIEELRGLLARKERFMNSMSHELRTPLNGIIGISEGMLSGCCGRARLLSLIHDVMDAAVLNHKSLVLKQDPVMLRPLVDDVLDLTRSLVDSSVDLRNNVPPGMVVAGDAGRIVQILNNLLGNAAKFTRRGHIRVSARVHEAGQMAAVTIADTGIGIPRHKLDGIFHPFEQVDKATTRKYGGCGLGLNIVQELVKAHGGDIWVESQESLGSAFTFLLPMMQQPSSSSWWAAGPPNTPLDAFETSVQGRMPQPCHPQMPTDERVRQAAAATSGYQRPGVRRRSWSPWPADTGGLSGSGGSSSVGVRSALGPLSRSARSHRSVSEWAPALGKGPLINMPVVDYNSAELSAMASSTRFDSSQGVLIPLRLPRGQWPRELPRSSLPLPLQQPGGGLLGSAQAGPARRQAHSVKHGRYLLLSVDDDPVNQSVVRSLLSSTGYEIVTVPSGPAAVAYLEACESLPDVILLDCMMPGMDGYAVLAKVRSMFTHTYIPVIMVSAQAEEGHVVQGLDQGADDYVTKPFNRLEFLARIKAQLGFEGDDEDEGREQGGGGCESRLNQQRLILCIDDDEINQMILAGMLRSQLYSSHTPIPDRWSPSGSDRGGRLSGCTEGACRFLVPIIMLSARHNEAAIVEGLQCGANDYVTKPFRRGELLARIRMALRSRNGAATDDARDNVGENGPVRRLSRAASLDLISTAKAEDGKASACTLPALRHLSRTYDSSHDDFSDLFNLNTLSTGHQHHSQSAPHPPIAAPVIARSAGSSRPPPSPAPPSPTWHDVGVVVAQIVEPVTGGPGGALSASEGASVRDRFAEMFRMVEAQHGLSHLAGGEGVLSSGASLLALHRAALALLDGASWLALPRARTGSLMVRVAIHAGPVSGPPNATGHASPVAVANPRETLELLLSGATALLQWAPPMTAVCGDLAALHLREMGLGNVRELPLALLQAGAQQPDRRVWLVEAHALSNLAPPTLPGMRASQPSQPSRRPPGSSNLYTAEWAHHPAPDASSSWVGSNTNLFASLQGQAQRPAQHSGGQASPSGHSPRLTSGWRQQQQQQQCAAVGQSAESATTSRGSREEIDELKRKVNSLKMQLEVAHARAVLSSAGSTTPGGIHNDADDNAAREPAKRTLSRPSALQERKDKTV
ncbi:MAG: hypothetical protein WDW38_000984 [Sanguina aurantia]